MLFTSTFLLFILIPFTAPAKHLDGLEQSVQIKPRTLPLKPSAYTISSNADISHVVVKFKDDYEVRFRQNKFFSKKGYSLSKAEDILSSYTATGIKRLFKDFSEDKLERDKIVLEHKTRQELANLNSYYEIDVTNPSEAEQLVNRLNALDIVEIAYCQPKPEVAGDIDPPTPDYSAEQDYREAAPAGVDADYANTLPGGDGSGVKIIDLENAWQTTHEDLEKALNGIIGGEPPSYWSTDHGTAVLGELIAGDNGYGVTGICPGADVGMISSFYRNTAEAIYLAVENLEAGDIILIEQHAPGPHYDFESRDDQLGFVCMEYWQANYDAMLYAWANGITVVEAAGNGSENFDDPVLYGSLFDTTYRNSHAIIAGAGYAYISPDNLKKLDFSNYGERVNLQGYGRNVYTTGYGDLFEPDYDVDQRYTAYFSGTSSASPIVTGAVACLQGYYKALYGWPMNADQIRDALVATGTPQEGNLSLHIGPRPDLQAAIPIVKAPSNIYASPPMIDAEVLDGNGATEYFWIVNRSTTQSYEFSIVDNDSLAKLVEDDWLVATPKSGLVPANDSTMIEVYLDGGLIGGRLDIYKGALEISWGETGMLDSLLLVPAFFSVLCNDQTYSAASSDDPEGPAYAWISAKDLGSKISYDDYYAKGEGLDSLDDGTTGPWPINFNFPFYDGSYTEMYIGVNGALSFTDIHVNEGGYYTTYSIPGVPFATFVSPFWNDLIILPATDPDAGIYLYTTPTNDTTVIEWYHVSNFNNTEDYSTNFEIILTDDGKVLYQYKNVGVSSLEQVALIGISEIECNALSYFDSGDKPEHIVSNSEVLEFYGTSRVWVRSGDPNNDGNTNISDITFIVSYLFGGGPPPSIPEMGNANCDEEGSINISDITYLVAYLFGGGPEPCYFWLYQ